MQVASPPPRGLRWEPIHAALALAILVHAVAILAWMVAAPRGQDDSMRVVAEVDVVDRLVQPQRTRLPAMKLPEPRRVVPPSAMRRPLPAEGRDPGRPGRLEGRPAPAAAAPNLRLKYPTASRRERDPRSPLVVAPSEEGSATGRPFGSPEGSTAGSGEGGNGPGGSGTGGDGGGGGGQGGTGGDPPVVTKPHHWHYFPSDEQPHLIHTGEANMPESEFRGLGHAKVWVEFTVPANGGAAASPTDIRILKVEPLEGSSLASDAREKRLAGLAYLLCQSSTWRPGLRNGESADHRISFAIEINGPAVQ